jgi:uncharacterized protein YciI
MIVDNGKQDAESFYINNQPDMLQVLNDRFKILENHIKYLKKLLKEPEIIKFGPYKK